MYKLLLAKLFVYLKCKKISLTNNLEQLDYYFFDSIKVSRSLMKLIYLANFLGDIMLHNINVCKRQTKIVNVLLLLDLKHV